MFHFATSSLEREVLGGVEGWEEGLESKFLASALDVAPGRIMAKRSCEKKVNEADVLWRFITTSPWCGPGTRSRLMGSSLPWVTMRLVCIRRGVRLRLEMELRESRAGAGRSDCGVINTGHGRLASEAHTRLL
jgi:hypothetical protein